MSGTFLCLLCRNDLHKTSICPLWHQPDMKDITITRSIQEEQILRKLQEKANDLCDRCNTYNILKVFETPEIKDEAQRIEKNLALRHAFRALGEFAEKSRYQDLKLGSFKDIVLCGSCPLCRLIFRVFPDVAVEDLMDSAVYFLSPFASYDRQTEILRKTSDELKAQYAIHFAVESDRQLLRNLNTREPDTDIVTRFARSFGLSSQNPPGSRRALRVRPVNDQIDFQILKSWIETCISNHETCLSPWSDELMNCYMIDVNHRKIVPCPRKCQYLALSYVWGGVQPEQNALEDCTLPKTLEDAITVTKEIGLKYLWVDALCIDQKPGHEKQKQIEMMDIIYLGAVATIVDMDGQNSDHGLPGVRIDCPRQTQGREVIDDKVLLTIPPHLVQLIEKTKYFTRAWTLQESLLGHRKAILGSNQMHFFCRKAHYSECIDDTFDPAKYLNSGRIQGIGGDIWADNPMDVYSKYTEEQKRLVAEKEFRLTLDNYTQRHMTHDSDSLNAFTGILKSLTRDWLPNGFICGLPLVDFPNSLRWYHPRQIKPKRRPQFPSWSWAGWEGHVTYSEPFDSRNDDLPVGYDPRSDMMPKLVNFDGFTLTILGLVVKLDVKTEPFSDVFVHGTDELLGMLRERNFSHNNTVPTGVYDFLVVERVKYKSSKNGPLREDIYMLLLDWDGDIATRQTKVRLFIGPGGKFEQSMPVRKNIQLK